MAIDESGDGFLDLAVALEGLRQELEVAWEAGQGQRVRFRVSEVSLSVQAVARKDREAGGKVRWWLVEAGGTATSATETTQTLVLSLSPSVYDDQGRPAPLDVFGDQPVPGG
jgi:Trypsin-co-occurring domain 2